MVKAGNWSVLKKLAENPDKQIRKAVHGATVKAALLLVREIKRGIVSQAPGGVPFAPLAESTIAGKHSSKALIDHGFLLNAITHKIMSDGAFIGLLKTSLNGEGESLANIGAIMEYGATIPMPNGNSIVIPARPFLHPVMKKYQSEVLSLYREALKTCLPSV